MNFIGKNAAAKSDDYDFKYIIEGGRFFVKNKEELKNWTNNLDKEQLVKEKIQAHMAGVSAIYSHVESKKNAKNEMPSIMENKTIIYVDRERMMRAGLFSGRTALLRSKKKKVKWLD